MAGLAGGREGREGNEGARLKRSVVLPATSWRYAPPCPTLQALQLPLPTPPAIHLHTRGLRAAVKARQITAPHVLVVWAALPAGIVCRREGGV